MSDLGPVTYESCPLVGVQWHPLADVFPWIEGPAFDDFKADIAANGVHDPIVFLDGQVLDGRNRYTAARELGIEYPRCEYVGSDPLGFVISANLKRRHMNESQRAMAASKLAKLEVGANQYRGSANLPTQSEAASLLSVSERTLRTAKTVQEQGAPELVAAVESGAVKVSAAADIASLPHDEQAAIVSEGSAAVKDAAAEVRRNKRASINTESHSMEDRGDDLYETPSIAMTVLLDLETFTNYIWEPACGKGAIVRMLHGAGYEVLPTDINDYGVEDQRVVDFLEASDLAPAADIVTNPPYKIADKFVAKAVLESSARKVAMLLRLNFMAGCNDVRKSIMEGEHKPARIHVFSRRLPMMHRDGWDGPEASSSMDLAWFIWDRDYLGPTVINRVDWKDYE